jgi:hemerythrin superfamily protein
VAIQEPSTKPAKSFEREGQPPRLDAITLLVRDHRAVQQALNDHQRCRDAAERARLIRQVMLDLKRHEQAEELAFWPFVARELPDGDRLAAARQAEEGRAKRTMTELQAMSPGDRLWDDTVRTFISQVLTHASHEEREVFQKVRSSVHVERLMQLADEIEAAKAG